VVHVEKSGDEYMLVPFLPRTWTEPLYAEYLVVPPGPETEVIEKELPVDEVRTYPESPPVIINCPPLYLMRRGRVDVGAVPCVQESGVGGAGGEDVLLAIINGDVPNIILRALYE
jgi:hypothetical protein